MTMFSFRVDDEEASEVDTWARRLGIDRSELLRTALHRHVVRLRSESETEVWLRKPLSDEEKALSKVAEWGPAEDWTDWHHAER